MVSDALVASGRLVQIDGRPFRNFHFFLIQGAICNRRVRKVANSRPMIRTASCRLRKRIDRLSSRRELPANILSAGWRRVASEYRWRSRNSPFVAPRAMGRNARLTAGLNRPDPPPSVNWRPAPLAHRAFPHGFFSRVFRMPMLCAPLFSRLGTYLGRNRPFRCCSLTNGP